MNDDKNAALNVLKHEFELDHQLSVLSKPYIAFMDGYTSGYSLFKNLLHIYNVNFLVGGGAGIALPAPIRISTDSTVFSFPETRLGYAPDVGASYYLSRLDGQLGTYLSLTGQTVSGSDLYHLGISTHHISPSLFPALIGRLNDLSSSVSGADLNSIIDEFSNQPLPKLSDKFKGVHRQAIDDAFGQNSIEEIIQVLENFSKNNSDVSDWAKETLDILYSRPPTSLKVSLEAMRRGMKMHNVVQALQQEITFANAFINKSYDFRKGVQAVLVDKSSKKLDWTPNSFKEVNKNTVIGDYFTVTERTSSLLDIKNEKKPFYQFQQFSLPTEREIEHYVRGSHPASGANVIKRSEVITFFKNRNPVKYAVHDKVNEVLDRCTKEMEGGYLEWK